MARLTPFVAQPRTFLPAAEAATALAGAPPWGERDPLPEDQTRGQRIVGCMAGRATTNLATDELMDLLRN